MEISQVVQLANKDIKKLNDFILYIQEGRRMLQPENIKTNQIQLSVISKMKNSLDRIKSLPRTSEQQQ